MASITPYTQHGLQTDYAAEPMTDTLELPFKKLAFPLNVYAKALLLQEGQAEYLHYGLFQNAQTSLKEAQQYSTDLLISKLPPPPCRILEIGIGFGKTYSQLLQKGYDVFGITPNTIQVDYVRQSLGAEASVSLHSLETFSAELESFDVILLQESSQHINPLTIFNKALELLQPMGDLIILDEFTFKHQASEPSNLHGIDDIIALATRLGFELLEHSNLSQMAAPTLDYWLQAIHTHRQHLLHNLDVSTAQLDQLDHSNRLHREKYRNGQYGYALLHFRKKDIPRWRLQFLENEHSTHMQELFRRIFHHEMPIELWQWKYATENSRALGIWRENRLVAHYGGIGRSILFFGKHENAVQIGDVMVEAKEQSSLARKGLFYMMAATFLEHYIGYGKRYLLGFGFPNQRAMKVAERLGLYGEVGEMVELSWKPQLRSPLIQTHLKLIDLPTKTNIKAVNKCWQNMVADMQTSIIGLRDWPYIQQRYLNHPTQRYQIILIKNRLTRNPRGVLVLRYENDECELIDLIASITEIPLLVTQAKRLAALNKASRLFCRITENFTEYFSRTQATQQAIGIKIPTSIWCDGPTTELLKNHWWLMGGDMDFR
ncbi:cyclopropane fatty-acyl-phospholipid synthase [Nitrosomonas sp. PY1]|uniref:GNAT family N-acetyltransferase n=1 Tax=Nitrosomonas sp. PY1 TaxID=1803906 RepID=UPI001FC8E1B3|nr:GNAT family N-acetyltransferase [Nitrosomonas sp. PY1]GKS68191.1 cyclopropane fatty-acyl-phospholipid synthase [Nitrosomonas sp. PY1]